MAANRTNFFDRVSKSTLLALLDEVGGPALSGRYAASKKSEISASCEKLFAGEAIVEDEVRDKATSWVPNTMLFLDGMGASHDNQETDPEADANDDDGGDDEPGDIDEIVDASGETSEANDEVAEDALIAA